MSAPPTLVIDEDDERTIVDPRLPAGRPSSELERGRSKQVIGHWATSLRNRWRPLLAGVAGGGLCLSIVTLALHQRRLSERLQRAIDIVQTTATSLDPAEAMTTPTSQEARLNVPKDSLERAGARGTPSREALELEAATFVVANDYRAALESYRVLAERFPGERSFSDLVTILRAKVACHGNREAEGIACD